MMKDNEIIKALEVCSRGEFCAECPRVNSPAHLLLCQEILMSDALDLINRQQAEIENQSQNFKVLVSDHRCLQQSFDNLKSLYQAEKEKVEGAKSKSIYFAKELQKARAEINRVTALAAEWKDAAYTYADNIDKIKAEAIKEFAEILKEKADYYENGQGWEGDIYYADDVDNLVKEMVGDTE